ncbi:MAG: MarR family transcriptional regulator [Fimbriimonadaceae bacterium]|nr:MarR family transcriptional regulator [Chitinophagales bacterium]
MRLEDEIQQQKFGNEYHKLSVNISYTGSWLSGKHIQFFKKHKLSPQQYNVLRILRGQYPRPASVNLLIERMLDKMSNASRLVDKLCDKQLTNRKVSKKDRRQVDVIITGKGLELLKKLDVELLSIEDELKKLNKAEVTTLNELLDKLRG